MISTLLHYLRSVLLVPYLSQSFSHLNVLVCLILAILSYRFLFYSQEIFNLILDLFLVCLPLICVLLTPGLQYSSPQYRHCWLSWYSLHWCLCSFWNLDLSEHYIPLVNYLMIFLVDSLSLTLLVLFLNHALLQSLVAAQHFFSLNLANVYPHLLLLVKPLNCIQSQSNFLTLIGLYITSIVLINLLPNIGMLCLSLSL